jgi:hypothetical protein
MFSAVMTVEIIWLLLLSPSLLHLMENFYRVRDRKSHRQKSGANSENGLDEERWKASMSDRRDIVVAFVSYLLQAVSQFCIALSQTGTQMILCQ